MCNASDKIASRQGNKARPYKCRPGWNDYSRDLHTAAGECFVMWVDAGKHDNGLVFDLKKSSRAKFK